MNVDLLEVLKWCIAVGAVAFTLGFVTLLAVGVVRSIRGKNG